MAEPASGSKEELLQYLQQLSGRSIRTRAELEAYLNELKMQAESPRPTRAQRGWTIARHAALGVGLLIALLQYYLIDIYVQILSLQRVQYLNPDPVQVQKSALDVLSFLC